MSTSVPNFNFLALIVSEIWRGPKIKSSSADLPRQILHAAILPANAYQCIKFQPPSPIGFEDMEGSQNKKWELLISPDGP